MISARYLSEEEGVIGLVQQTLKKLATACPENTSREDHRGMAESHVD